MPAGTVPVYGANPNLSFELRLGSDVVTQMVPVDGIGNVSFSDSNESSTGQMSFTIEDPSGTYLIRFGTEVQLIDKRSGTDEVIFGGHLIEADVSPGPANRGRIYRCTALGYDAWLDWRIVPRFTSRSNVQKRINKYDTDRKMVQALINRFGGDLKAPDGTINMTNNDMPNVAVVGMTLREALDAIAEAATPGSDSATRFFYVDDQKRLHWYKETENLTPPYHLTEGVYTRYVIDDGATAFWKMGEPAGTTNADLARDAVGTNNAQIRREPVFGQPGTINNEPQWTSVYFDGVDDALRVSGATAHLADTWTFEVWFKRSTTLGTNQTLWFGGTGEPHIRFTTTNKLEIIKRGTGQHYVSTASITDTAWHHLVITRSPGDTDVYLDKAVLAGSVTAQTFSATSGDVDIAWNGTTPEYFHGWLQGLSVYATKLTETQVVRHHTVGSSVVPEDFTMTLSAYDGREAVYIAGKNIAGSGWVRQRDWLQDTAFGRRADWGKPDGEPERQAFIEREQSEDDAKRRAIGRAYLRRHTDPQVSGSFTVTGFDGWKVGQKIRIHMPSLDIRNTPDDGLGYPFEIRDVSTSVGMGNGVMTHSIDFGQAKLRATRILSKSRRR